MADTFDIVLFEIKKNQEFSKEVAMILKFGDKPKGVYILDIAAD